MSKNILFIHHSSSLGGAERHLLSLVQALDKGYKVFFICQEPGPLSDALKASGAEVYFMPLGAWRKFRYLIKNFFTVRSIIDLCKTHQIDLICSNNYRVTPYAVWPAKSLKIPALTIIQDFVDDPKLRKFSTFKSDALIAVSESIADTVRGHYFREITTIYNGIDTAVFTASLTNGEVLRKEFPELMGKRIIGKIAQIVPLKGHKDFLKAMKIVADQSSDVMFVVIGESPDEGQLSIKDLKDYAKEIGLSGKVVFTGLRSDVPSLLKSFDILVHCAHREPFGRVIMEAMALSVPVVATACGGPGEIIEDGKNGILVPVGDGSRLAGAVMMLLNDKEKRDTIGREGLRRIEQFSLQNTVKHINGVLGRILTAKG